MPPKKARLSAEATVNNILRFVENDEDKCVKTLCQDTPTPTFFYRLCLKNLPVFEISLREPPFHIFFTGLV